MLGEDLPCEVARLLRETPAATRIGRGEVRLIATPRAALDAAAAVALAAGVEPEILSDDLEGESREVARDMAERVDRPSARPSVLISGGETTVTLAGASAGRGGRNTEFLLALAAALHGRADVWALAADTDGEDGASGGAAGAIIGPDTLARAEAAGLDPLVSLAAHDSGGFFERLGDLVVTGPTRTNVNDFRAILVLPQGIARERVIDLMEHRT